MNTLECGFNYANIYDNLDSTFIVGSELVVFYDTLTTLPFTICNFDTIPIQFMVELYNEDSTLICSKVITAFLYPCPLEFMRESGSNDKEPFDLVTKTIKTKEITFEYDIKEDEKIEIELFNKYGISQGVILDRESKKGTNEFKLNIENYKSGIYVFKMKGKKDTVQRRLIIE